MTDYNDFQKPLAEGAAAQFDFLDPLGKDEEMNKIQTEAARADNLKSNPVIRACQTIQKYVEKFEAQLDNEHEVGGALDFFGGNVFFHAEIIGFSTSSIITFYGTTEEGEKLQSIQHVSQLNFLLKKAEKTEDKARRVGFIWEETAQSREG
jgi:Family of unknown function (DUF6173)